MRLFPATADMTLIESLQHLKCCDGLFLAPDMDLFTDFDTLGSRLFDLVSQVQGPVIVPLRAVLQDDVPVTVDALLTAAREALSWSPGLVFLLEADQQGLDVLQHLKSRDIDAAVEVESAAQGILAAKAGADMVLTMPGHGSDLELATRLLSILDNYAFETEILAGPLRTAQELEEGGLIGLDGAVVAPELMTSLLQYR